MKKINILSVLLFFMIISSYGLHGKGRKNRSSPQQKIKKNVITSQKKASLKKNTLSKKKNRFIKKRTLSSQRNNINRTSKRKPVLSDQKTHESIDEELEYWTKEDLEDQKEIQESNEKVGEYLKNLPSERPKSLSENESFESVATPDKKTAEEEEFWDKFDKEHEIDQEAWKKFQHLQ